MSEAKHTPGPWTVTGHGAGEGMISHQTGHVAFTAFPWNVEESRDDGESWIDMRERTQPDRSKLRAEKLANAHLIAAAPELLDACKQAAVLHEDDEGIAQVLLAAIAKAEDRS